MRIFGIWLLLVLSVSVAFADSLSKAVKVVHSASDFLQTPLQGNTVVVDRPSFAHADLLNELDAWIKKPTMASHHWAVVFLDKLPADSFVQKIESAADQSTGEIGPGFLGWVDPGTHEADHNLILIGRIKPFSFDDPHYAIRVYAGPYFTSRGVRANGDWFKQSVLPRMKALCNDGSPIDAAKFAIAKFENELGEVSSTQSDSSIAAPHAVSQSQALQILSGRPSPPPTAFAQGGAPVVMFPPGMGPVNSSLPGLPESGTFRLFFTLFFGVLILVVLARVVFVALGIGMVVRSRDRWPNRDLMRVAGPVPGSPDANLADAHRGAAYPAGVAAPPPVDFTSGSNFGGPSGGDPSGGSWGGGNS